LDLPLVPEVTTGPLALVAFEFDLDDCPFSFAESTLEVVGLSVAVLLVSFCLL
jgi:hypothetical protein